MELYVLFELQFQFEYSCVDAALRILAPHKIKTREHTMSGEVESDAKAERPNEERRPEISRVMNALNDEESTEEVVERVWRKQGERGGDVM